jgi:hypothetical protein
LLGLECFGKVRQKSTKAIEKREILNMAAVSMITEKKKAFRSWRGCETLGTILAALKPAMTRRRGKRASVQPTIMFGKMHVTAEGKADAG